MYMRISERHDFKTYWRDCVYYETWFRYIGYEEFRFTRVDRKGKVTLIAKRVGDFNPRHIIEMNDFDLS
jgi:hypothetical protein